MAIVCRVRMAYGTIVARTSLHSSLESEQLSGLMSKPIIMVLMWRPFNLGQPARLFSNPDQCGRTESIHHVSQRDEAAKMGTRRMYAITYRAVKKN